MRNPPLISVGIPAYDHAVGLERALECITNQTYRNLEIIISDNASPDPQVERVARKFQHRDARIQYYRQDKNMGAASNFRFVFEKAHGEYFMWAADDDSWESTYISSLLKELEDHPDAIVAMSAVSLVDEGGQALKTVRFNVNNPNSLGYYSMAKMLTASGKKKQKLNYYIYGLFRRKPMELTIRDFQDVYISDRLYLCQLALTGRFRYLDEILYIRQIHSKSVYDRYPDENFSKAWNRIWKRFYALPALIWMLIKSKVIPLHRKIYIPVIAWRLFVLLYRNVLAEM
jgi:glycosyltransferase involved in cell wall biosynthesis